MSQRLHDMADRQLADTLADNPVAILAFLCWAVSVAVAVQLGDPVLVASGYLFLPAILVGWGGTILASADGFSLGAIGGTLLLLGGLGEYALYFGLGPAVEPFAVTVIWLLGLVAVVADRRE
ncbi:hypothetical protein [Haloarchaeobius baliensis]|uniref:hypothetical protein n=1 Tax=Haloarchaeobius baliensis TaxID=1670458 RepID=UPI003F8820A2